MLVFIDDNRRILSHNIDISKEDASQHIGAGAIWVDNLIIKFPTHDEDTQSITMYLNDDNTIRYDIVDIIPQPTLVTIESLDYRILEVGDTTKSTEGTVLMTSEDALTIMEYQTVLDEKLSKIITHLGL